MALKKVASTLLEAERTKHAIAPLTKDLSLTKDDAYKIQLETIKYKKNLGAKIVGKKIGLTSKAMQEMLGVDMPDYGHLLDSMIYEENTPISLDEFIQPKAEFEIGFILKGQLKGPGITREDVMQATDYVVPAIEIIDTRIKDWEIKFEDTVADNGSSAGAIIGQGSRLLSEIDLSKEKMTVYHNDKQIDSAYGSAVLGNPVEAVVWLANEIGRFGISLEPGEIILAGALSKALDIEVGDKFTAEFENLGTVSAVFKE